MIAIELDYHHPKCQKGDDAMQAMGPTGMDRSSEFFFRELGAYVLRNVSPEFDSSQDRLIDVLDSVGLLQLIVHIEQEFQIFLDPASLSIEVFLDLNSLSQALAAHAAA